MKIDTLKKIIFILTPEERKLAIWLYLMILVMATLDIIGIASILPFITVLTNPEIIQTNYFLSSLFNFLSSYGVNTNKKFLFFLGFSVFVFLILSLTFKAITIYFQIRFSSMREYTIGKRLVEGYLNQPYVWFLSRHSADISKSVLSEIGIIINNGIKSSIDLITYSTITIFLIILLLIVDIKLTILTGLILGSAYLIIYNLTRNFLKFISQERLKANEGRFKIITEAFGAAKEIKINNLEDYYLNRFSIFGKKNARYTASFQIVGRLPRFLIEGVVFGGMVLMILYLMSKTGTFSSVIPIISVFAFAGYRLIPALQQIYVALNALRYVESSLGNLYDDIKSLDKEIPKTETISIKLHNEIKLDKITFSYPGSTKFILKEINLTIPAKKKIGFIGSTGSGKTTIVDIILGLLEPNKGNLEIDGEKINRFNVRRWQKNIGYVPQNIFLADDSLEANIAFGHKIDTVDKQQIIRSAKAANLHDFIVNELPLGYQTKIGERGVRLSGGQRQRLGIARALYDNPKVLILDEATSALDNITEKKVMESIYNLGTNMTVIIIAHRLSTVKKCDTIYHIDNGILKKKDFLTNW